jgi:glycosyltransferase involved in cell wall biosynthesis
MIVGVDARELQGRPTGTGRYLRNLLRHWSRTAPGELIAYFNGPAPDDPVLDDDAIVKRPLGGKPTRGLLWQEWRLPAAVTHDPLDVFFSPAYTCPLRLRVPRVTTVHDLSFFAQPSDFTPTDGFRRRALARASLRVSTAIVAVSAFTRREILTRFPHLEGRVHHVPEGADDDLPQPPDRHEARARLGMGEGPLLLTVGTILNRRCLPVLLRSVAGLRHDFPGLRLEVVGDDRTHPPLALPRLVHSLGLEQTVRLRGFVSEAELADCYAAADVFLFLSEYEGFGLPVLEAMTRGLPVVTTQRPALSELFGEAAILVDPHDENGLACTVARILRAPGLAGQLVSRGRALAASFSWEDTATQTWRLLGTAAATPR